MRRSEALSVILKIQEEISILSRISQMEKMCLWLTLNLYCWHATSRSTCYRATARLFDVQGERDISQTIYYGIRVYVCKTEPTMVEEVLCTPEKDHWCQAMEKEMKSLKDNDVWELLSCQKVAKQLGASGSSRSKQMLMDMLKGSKGVLWLKAFHRSLAWIMTRLSALL